MIKFYDTNALLILQDQIFKASDEIYISNITFKELENIKMSGTKDNEIKWSARNILRLLASHEEEYEIVLYKSSYEEEIAKWDLPNNDDSKIVLTARKTFEQLECMDFGVFITQDLSCKKIADCIGLNTEYIKPKEEDYTGYITVEFSESELAEFYEHTLLENENKYNLLINQYLLISFQDRITDKYKWTKNGYKKIGYATFESMMFGKVGPYAGDIYQQCAIDSLKNNQITVMRGKPGSGKSYLAISYLMEQLEKNKIDKIIIFCTRSGQIRFLSRLPR